MVRFVFLFLSFLAVASAQNVCQMEGFEQKKDNMWQLCSGGKWKPVACISKTDDRVDEGSSFQDTDYIYTCSKSPENADALRLVGVACFNNGVLVEPDQIFYKNNAELWRCAKVGADLKAQPAGCIDKDGQPMQDGARTVRDNVAFTCQNSQLTPTACVFGNDEYRPGSDAVVSTIFYRCEKDSKGQLALKLKGCIENSTKFEIGQRFKDFWFLYECQNLGGTALRVGVGCVERYPNGTVAEYKPDDKWFVGSGDYNRYQITCKREGLTIRRKGIACYFKTRDGEGLLSGGCMRKVGFQVIQCTAPTPATPNVRIRITENPTDADWTRLRGTGLKEC